MDLIGFLAMLFVGGSLGLIGGGGAVLTVPILVYLFKTPAILATTYSLFVVGVSSLFGVFRYHNDRNVDYGTAVKFAVPSFVGTFLARRVLMPTIPEIIFQVGEFSFRKDRLIMSVFATVMLGASYSMIRKSVNPAGSSRVYLSQSFLLALLGLCVGFVAGFVGAGGGFLIIPALVVFAKIPMQRAIGTSLLIISTNSLFGFFGDLFARTELDWKFLSIITMIAGIGIFIGTYISKYVSAAKLKPAFGWFVLVMGVYVMLLQIVK